MSTVDVVVPCYNYARYLRSCVESVLNQEGVEVRVLIIDDASPDDTPNVGRMLAAQDPRVTYRRHEVNEGFFRTINEGMLGWASAEYFLLLSADDALSQGALARATSLMNDHPEIGLTYGMGMVIDGEQSPEGAPQPKSPEHRIIPGREFLEVCCKVGNPVPTPTAVVRTGLQHALGAYDADLPHTSDYEMWMRFALRSDVGVINAVQGYYRRHGANMSAYYNADPTRDLRECTRAVAKIVAEGKNTIEHPSRLLDLSNRRCADAALHSAHKLFEAGDSAGSKICIAFAAEHGLPALRSPTGRALFAKQLLGRKLYSMNAPMAAKVRGKNNLYSEGREFGGSKLAVDLIGYWPVMP